MATRNLNAEQLRKLLDYDPETGVFTFSEAHYLRGKRAGCLRRVDGYRRIQVGGMLLTEHRLAWLHVYGHLPTKYIDHIDGNRANNAIANLREATNRQNQQNRTKALPQNALGIKNIAMDFGDSRNKTRAVRFRVTMRTIDGKRFDRRYKTLEEARAAVEALRPKLQPFAPKM